MENLLESFGERILPETREFTLPEPCMQDMYAAYEIGLLASNSSSIQNTQDFIDQTQDELYASLEPDLSLIESRLFTASYWLGVKMGQRRLSRTRSANIAFAGSNVQQSLFRSHQLLHYKSRKELPKIFRPLDPEADYEWQNCHFGVAPCLRVANALLEHGQTPYLTQTEIDVFHAIDLLMPFGVFTLAIQIKYRHNRETFYRILPRNPSLLDPVSMEYEFVHKVHALGTDLNLVLVPIYIQIGEQQCVTDSAPRPSLISGIGRLLDALRRSQIAIF